MKSGGRPGWRLRVGVEGLVKKEGVKKDLGIERGL